ncbi:MAG: hypothetical protein K0S32_610 [Bacteroidetes bacterium]|nr:hypothetical protein [Bacteroidota bacterium]
MQRVLSGLIAILLLTSCRENKLDVDISNINTEPLKVMRLEEDVFTIGQNNVDSVTEKILDRYGSFYDHYISTFLNRRGSRDSLYKPAIVNFTHDRDILGCYAQVKKYYTPELISEIEPELNNCVKRFKHHFPNRKLPKRLITCLTGWNYAWAYLDTSLVLGLDMYLGDTCVYYQMLKLPQYQTRYMNHNYIVPGLAFGWMVTEFDNSDSVVNTLLHHTIFYGKIYYAVNALLPQHHDTLLLNYSTIQFNYCQKYEKNLWSYFAEKNRLYENNIRGIHELIDPGPFTGVISKECPPRIAMWIGLQIVRSYMKNNDVTLEQLMAEKDLQKILNKSKYRP